MAAVNTPRRQNNAEYRRYIHPHILIHPNDAREHSLFNRIGTKKAGRYILA
jgi:hypothetical protein